MSAKCDYCGQPGIQLTGETNGVLVCIDHAAKAVTPRYTSDDATLVGPDGFTRLAPVRMAEREALRSRLASWFGDDRQAFLVSHLAPVVERIVADRLAEAEFHIQQLAEARDRAEARTERDEHQWNALEMARRAEQAERRAEDAEAEVERLRDLLRETLQQQPFRVAEANRLRAEEAEYHVEQLRDARDSAERRIERAERLIDSWENDAPDHSNPVFIGRLRECLRRDPAPVRLRGEERCVVCSRLAPLHGGLCCFHKYDEQPLCIHCASDEDPACEHEWLDRPESDTRECLICGTEVAG